MFLMVLIDLNTLKTLIPRKAVFLMFLMFLNQLKTLKTQAFQGD